MIAQTCGTLIHIGWCHLFTVKLQYGVEGLGYATTITYFTMLVMITINTLLIKRISKCIFCPTLESFTGWGAYLKLSIPSTIMLCAEWWSFEIMIILAGIIGIIEQAVNVITFNVISQLFMIPLGMQEASCALIGNEIGANNPKLAKKYFKVISTIASLC